MNNKLYFLVLVISVSIAAGVTRYFFPKVEVQTTEVTKEVVRNDIKTIVRTIERPDGSKETVSETTDKSSKAETTKKELIVLAKSQYLFNLGVRTNLTDRVLVYDIGIEKRIFDSIYVGVKLSTDKTIGLSFTKEF